MSLQDDNLNDDNRQDRHSAPESLEQVLSSLQNMLEQKRFPFSSEQDKTNPVLEPVPEPFSEQPAELYDDPLFLDDDSIPLLQPEDAVNDDMHIPVLDDIIFKGLANDAGQGSDIELQLKQLRSELDAIVDDIMDEARQQFESGDSPPAENSLQRFLRELGQRSPGQG
jgi:hypothetical protein